MRNAISRVLLGSLAALAVFGVPSACASVPVPDSGVRKERLGDLRRNDLVVVDVTGMDRDVVTSVNGKTGTVHLVASDVGAATMQEVSDFVATNTAGMVSNVVDEVNRLGAAVADSSEALELLATEVETNTAYIARTAGKLGVAISDIAYLRAGVTSLTATARAYIPWLENYATNNYHAAWLANARVSYLEQWAASVSNQLLLADAPPDGLRYSHYFTASNGLLVATVNTMMRNNVRYLPDDSRIPAIGVYMASGVRSVVSTNESGVVSASTYPVLTLYSDGRKVWTSDPLDSTNYGWLVALVLALVGSAGGVLWRYVAKSSAASAVSDVERALDDIIAEMDRDPSPGEGSGPSVPGISDIVGPGGTEGD